MEGTLVISAKCSDAFFARIGEKEYNGYVPKWFPNPSVEHWGDYVELEIDLETGKILNWKKPAQKELKETFDAK